MENRDIKWIEQHNSHRTAFCLGSDGDEFLFSLGGCCHILSETEILSFVTCLYEMFLIYHQKRNELHDKTFQRFMEHLHKLCLEAEQYYFKGNSLKNEDFDIDPDSV